MQATAFDIVMVADPRFTGGTTSAIVADVEALATAGARIGLLAVRSEFPYLDQFETNPKWWALFDLEGVVAVNYQSDVSANCVFFHNPLVFDFKLTPNVQLKSEVAVLVTHHAPFNGLGELEYDPARVAGNIRRRFGLMPTFAPISTSVRRQLERFEPAVSLIPQDWPNVFDPSVFVRKTPILSAERVTIGRHSRPDPTKWGDRAAEIEAALPVSRNSRIRVMGCPRQHLETIGVDTSAWAILDFNEEPVVQFLERLDIFSYFYARHWFEAFGRIVAEAALTETACILDKRLETNFRDVGYFCQPDEVCSVVEHIKNDPKGARVRAAKARQIIVDRYRADSLEKRWKSLLHQDAAALPATPVRT